MDGRPLPRARDDASYLAFLGAGVAISLLAGIGLGALAPWLGERAVAAHGLLQAAGFLGLVVAGMSLRLFPRLARRRPLPAAIPATLLAVLLGGLGLATAGARAGWWLLALGFAAVALALAFRVVPPPRPVPGWWIAAIAAIAWWIAAAALAALALPGAVEWALVAGAGVSTAAAVQARMVPVFFGRRPPGALAMLPGLALYEAGAAAGSEARAALPLLAFGLVWLAVETGALRGRATRLTAASATAAPALLLANRMALLSAGLFALAPWSEAAGVAGFHVLAIGFLSVLIVGMARLLAPVFAIERASGGEHRLAGLAAPLLGAAAVLRAAAAFAASPVLLAMAGTADGLALAIFGGALAAAARGYGERRQARRPEA